MIEAVLVLSLEDPRNGCAAQFGPSEVRAGTEDSLDSSREVPFTVAEAWGAVGWRTRGAWPRGLVMAILSFLVRHCFPAFINWTAVPSWCTQAVSKACECHNSPGAGAALGNEGKNGGSLWVEAIGRAQRPKMWLQGSLDWSGSSQSSVQVTWQQDTTITYEYFLAILHVLWDLSSPMRDRTWGPPLTVRAPSPNQWGAREFPTYDFWIQAAGFDS